MEVIKRLAPNYWAGYYAVYVIVFAYSAVVFRGPLAKWPESESLFVAAAIFAVSAGSALLAALITEGGGYVVLLIPNRIKEIKKEGRGEGIEIGREEGIEIGREEGIEIGREEGREEGIEIGFQRGIRAGAESRGAKPAEAGVENVDRLKRLIALYEGGQITLDEFNMLIQDRSNGNS